MKRLGQVYLDNLLTLEEYQRQKRQLEDRLGSLVVPELAAVKQAGNLLENLSQLWEAANLGEPWQMLQAMLEGVYVDPVEEKSIVALKPKPAFRTLFRIATTKEASRVVLYNEKAPTFRESFDEFVPCSWWRRGRVRCKLSDQLRWPQHQRNSVSRLPCRRILPHDSSNVSARGHQDRPRSPRLDAERPCRPRRSASKGRRQLGEGQEAATLQTVAKTDTNTPVARVSVMGMNNRLWSV